MVEVTTVTSGILYDQKIEGSRPLIPLFVSEQDQAADETSGLSVGQNGLSLEAFDAATQVISGKL